MYLLVSLLVNLTLTLTNCLILIFKNIYIIVWETLISVKACELVLKLTGLQQLFDALKFMLSKNVFVNHVLKTTVKHACKTSGVIPI